MNFPQNIPPTTNMLNSIQRRKMLGITLIELMVTITIFGILAMVAMPSMTNFIERNRIDTTVDALSNSLRYARAEALRRGNDASGRSRLLLIRIAPSDADAPSTTRCASDIGSAQWSCGWRLIIDANNNQAYDPAGDTILESHPINQSNLRITHIGGNASFLEIRPNGRLDTWQGFAVTTIDNSGANDNGSSLCLNVGARLRIAKDDMSGASCTNNQG